jgi:hypothetical protein
MSCLTVTALETNTDPVTVGETGVMIAQLTPDRLADIDALIGTWTPILALVLPLVLGLAVRFDVLAEAKKAIAVGGAVVVAVVSLAGEDWSMVTFELVAARTVVAWSIAEAAYRIFDGLVNQFSPSGGGLNWLLAPRFGVIPARKDPSRTAQLDLLRDRRAA